MKKIKEPIFLYLGEFIFIIFATYFLIIGELEKCNYSILMVWFFLIYNRLYQIKKFVEEKTEWNLK